MNVYICVNTHICAGVNEEHSKGQREINKVIYHILKYKGVDLQFWVLEVLHEYMGLLLTSNYAAAFSANKYSRCW